MMRSLLSLGVSLARFFLSDHRRGAGDFYRLRDLSLTADRSSVNDHVVIRRGRASPDSPAPGQDRGALTFYVGGPGRI